VAHRAAQTTFSQRERRVEVVRKTGKYFWEDERGLKIKKDSVHRENVCINLGLECSFIVKSRAD
jgi:hypothetical protein